MNIVVGVLVVVVAILQQSSAQGLIEIQKHFEFEDALTDEQSSYWVWRSEASNLKTLRLEDGGYFHSVNFGICIRPVNTTMNVTLVLDDIRYSNDGPSDIVAVTFNGVAMGNFTTYEKWRSGHEWNVFRNSGQVGPILSLPLGEYLLSVSVLTDRWGVEIDRIRMNAENQSPAEPLFCSANLSYRA